MCWVSRVTFQNALESHSIFLHVSRCVFRYLCSFLCMVFAASWAVCTFAMYTAIGSRTFGWSMLICIIDKHILTLWSMLIVIQCTIHMTRSAYADSVIDADCNTAHYIHITRSACADSVIDAYVCAGWKSDKTQKHIPRRDNLVTQEIDSGGVSISKPGPIIDCFQFLTCGFWVWGPTISKSWPTFFSFWDLAKSLTEVS